jgi:hypothetical protein
LPRRRQRRGAHRTELARCDRKRCSIGDVGTRAIGIVDANRVNRRRVGDAGIPVQRRRVDDDLEMNGIAAGSHHVVVAAVVSRATGESESEHEPTRDV